MGKIYLLEALKHDISIYANKVAYSHPIVFHILYPFLA